MVQSFWRGLSYETKAAVSALAVIVVVSAGFAAALAVTAFAGPTAETAAAPPESA